MGVYLRKTRYLHMAAASLGPFRIRLVRMPIVGDHLYVVVYIGDRVVISR